MLSTQVLAASRDCQSARRARVRQARRGPNAAVPCVRPEGRAPLSILVVALRQTTHCGLPTADCSAVCGPTLAQSVSLFGAFCWLAHWWAIITRVSYELDDAVGGSGGVCGNGASPDTRGATVGSATVARQVLRFYCYWDDRPSMFGDARKFVLYYYLADDTIEVPTRAHAHAALARGSPDRPLRQPRTLRRALRVHRERIIGRFLSARRQALLTAASIAPQSAHRRTALLRRATRSPAQCEPPCSV